MPRWSRGNKSVFAQVSIVHVTRSVNPLKSGNGPIVIVPALTTDETLKTHNTAPTKHIRMFFIFETFRITQETTHWNASQTEHICPFVAHRRALAISSNPLPPITNQRHENWLYEIPCYEAAHDDLACNNVTQLRLNFTYFVRLLATASTSPDGYIHFLSIKVASNITLHAWV